MPDAKDIQQTIELINRTLELGQELVQLLGLLKEKATWAESKEAWEAVREKDNSN